MGARACLKIHSRHLYPPLSAIFAPNEGYIARYAPFIWHKSPTKWRIHLSESNFKTRSRAFRITHLFFGIDKQTRWKNWDEFMRGTEVCPRWRVK